MQFPDDEQARAVQAPNATLTKAQAVPPAYAAVTTDLIKRIRRPDNEALSRLEMLKKASAHLVQDRLAKRKKQAASVAFWSRYVLAFVTVGRSNVSAPSLYLIKTRYIFLFRLLFLSLAG